MKYNKMSLFLCDLRMIRQVQLKTCGHSNTLHFSHNCCFTTSFLSLWILQLAIIFVVLNAASFSPYFRSCCGWRSRRWSARSDMSAPLLCFGTK